MVHDGQEWIDQMWYSGYCNDAVEHAAGTQLAGGSQQRIAWMEKHHPSCQECQYANHLRNGEAAIAQELGFFEKFMRGGDVTTLPGFGEKMAQYLTAQMQAGAIDPEMFAWMESVQGRHGSPWPGRVQ